MENVLLKTKVRIPPLPRRTVQRLRLIDTLESGIPQYKLILMSAPAGYGKTTLLTQWAQTSRYPIAWLSVSEDDNDLERFLRYLLRAWETVQPDIQDTELGLRFKAIAPDSKAVLPAFINVADAVPDHTVFVLDDYHLIQERSIHEALTFLLDNLPPTLHFVLAGREEPPLPLARYRARGEMLECRADYLRFTLEQATSYLNQTMGLNLDAGGIARLHNHLEGWITGLHLAALSLKQGQALPDATVGGNQRFIADYLSEDVLAHLDENVQHFLLLTSLPDRLCGALCDALTGQDNGQEMLDFLERENLFLQPLDDHREWFRYHRLFGDFLSQQLHHRHPDQVAEIHRRAAHWHYDHDLPDAAFRHAVAAGDVELVVQIVDRYCNAKLNGGEIRVVGSWANAIPAEWYAAYPVLGLARAGYLAFTGAFEDCVQHLDDVEQRLSPPEDEAQRWQLARVNSVRCMVACIQNDLGRAESYADVALQTLREEDLTWRPGIYNALGDTYRHNGRWEEANACYMKALSVVESPQMRFMSAHIYGALADLHLSRGRLRDADLCWRKALDVIQEPENWGRIPLPLIGWVYIRRAELQYEWNEPVEAWEQLERGLKFAEPGGDVRAMIAGYLIAGRMKLTEGDTEAAGGYLEQARPLLEGARFAHWNSRFERFQVEVWLAQNRLRAAVDWSDEMLREATAGEGPEDEVAQLAVGRVLIVKGNEPSIRQALSLIERLLQTAETEGRTGIVIEALALQALARWHLGERADALISLERALHLAEPESYVRLFADLGLPMARLLQEARSRSLMPDYVETLLKAFGSESPSPAQLVEPLTQREQEVLALVAAGLTNQEIAEKLVVSPETVKKHTGNIYSKLNVSNRTEAAARARALSLLD